MAVEALISDGMRRDFERVQKELRADIFGIGEELYRTAPGDGRRLADRREDVYASADLEVVVEVELRRTGLGR